VVDPRTMLETAREAGPSRGEDYLDNAEYGI